MDDIYQNNNNEDCPIKCNVVSNQLNFLNSIVYRDKVDFNNSLDHYMKEKVKKKSSDEDKDFSSAESEEEKEDLKNLLQLLFPNYHEHYYKDRSTWNPLIHHHNDTFDLSIHSFDYHNVIYDPKHMNESTSQQPFHLEDLSAI